MQSANGLCHRRGDADSAAPPAPACSRPRLVLGDRIAHRCACRPERDAGYSVLGFLAAHTKRVRLGTLLTGVTYRHPGLLVKTATTLDVLSGSRAWFGIGAAWFEREHLALGVPFPPLGERFERLEETLQIALQMWSPDNGPYHGQHYQLEETRPVMPPRSPPSSLAELASLAAVGVELARSHRGAILRNAGDAHCAPGRRFSAPAKESLK